MNGVFNSEAEAFQAIRKHWKQLRNHEQRKASLHQWEADHADRHPQVKRMTMAAMHMDVPVDSFHMPIERPEVAKANAKIARLNVAKYQHLLNGFKVKHD